MSVKKYLYREEQEVFDKIDATKKKYAIQKFTTKDAITFLINKGYETDTAPAVLGNDITLTPAPGVTLVSNSNVALPEPTGYTIVTSTIEPTSTVTTIPEVKT